MNIADQLIVLEKGQAALEQTCDSLSQGVEKLFQLHFSMDKRVGFIEQNMATKTDLSRIYTTLDKIVGMLDTDETERLAQNVQLNRHQSALDKHDLRITHLEQV